MYFPGAFGVAGAALFSNTNVSPPDPTTFTKDAYVTTVKKNRKEYVHKYFMDVLEPLFDSLKKDAELMKSCHKEVIFIVPDEFDFGKTEAVLCAYFMDLGYRPLTENRNDIDKKKLTITIT